MSAADAEALETLIEISKTPDGRTSLDLAGTLTALLPLLPSSSPSLLLPRLRLLRNLCAFNQTAFIDADGPGHVAAAVLSSPLPPPLSLHVALQLLGNVSRDEEPHRAAVWGRFFPAGFLALAWVPDPALCGTLSMVLSTCCDATECGGRARLRELCQDGSGLPILLGLISTASTVGHHENWLDQLLARICIEEHYFSHLFLSLGKPGVSERSPGDKEEDPTVLFTREQAFLLCIISEFFDWNSRSKLVVPNDFAPSILDVMKKASGVVDFYSRGSSSLPTGSPEVDVLGYSLVILKYVCARDSMTRKDHFHPLLSAGLLQLLISFLKELEPPSIVRKSIARARDQLPSPAIVEPLKVCPYGRFRKDVVSVISNYVSKSKQIQDELRKQNGILVLLQQCVVDEDNPFLKEWGILAIRNLLEGNLKNQREVADLQLRGAINTREIAELGLRVEIDDEGRPKLVNDT